jgi:hypothetical protein
MEISNREKKFVSDFFKQIKVSNDRYIHCDFYPISTDDHSAHYLVRISEKDLPYSDVILKQNVDQSWFFEGEPNPRFDKNVELLLSSAINDYKMQGN